jgi:hypothetical protein
MKTAGEKVNLNKIDLMQLKKKGLSNVKIGRMIGVPTRVVDKRIQQQQKYKQFSGVF